MYGDRQDLNGRIETTYRHAFYDFSQYHQVIGLLVLQLIDYILQGRQPSQCAYLPGAWEFCLHPNVLRPMYAISDTLFFQSVE